MRILAALIVLLVVGCADRYYVQGETRDRNGVIRSVSTKAFEKYSRTVGPGYVVATANKVEHVWNDPSPNVPRRIVTRTDPKTGIVTTDEMPIVASSDPSISTIATGNMVNRMAHGVSNIVGTVFAGWAGLEAARGLTAIGTTQSNNAAAVELGKQSAGTDAARAASRTTLGLAQ